MRHLLVAVMGLTLVAFASAAVAEEENLAGQPAHLFDDLNGDGQSDVSAEGVASSEPSREEVDAVQPVDEPTEQ